MSHFNNDALKTPEPKDASDLKYDREQRKLNAKLMSGNMYYIKQSRGVHCAYDDGIMTNIPAAAFTGTYVRNNRHMNSYQSVNGLGTLNALNEIFKYHKNGLKLVKTTKMTPTLAKSVESKVAVAVLAHCKKLGMKVASATATAITGTYKGKAIEITAASAWSWDYACIKVDGVLLSDLEHHFSFEDVKLLDVGPTLIRKPEFGASLLEMYRFDPKLYRDYILSAKTPKGYHDALLLETMKTLFKYFEFTTEDNELWLVPVGDETFGSAKEHIWSYNVTTATLHTNNGWISLDTESNPVFTASLWDLCHYVRFGLYTYRAATYNTFNMKKLTRTKTTIKFNEYSNIRSMVRAFLGI